MLKRLLLATFGVIALSLFPGASFVALADEGPTPVPSFHPPSGVLRRVDAPTASPIATAVAPSTAFAVVPAPTKQLVVLVGGYQSCWCADGLDEYEAAAKKAGYDVVHFGDDPKFPYDTYGSVAASGRTLRDEVRSLSGGYSAIHIITHSMGGAVADQAFAQGLSHDDGVATYVSLAGPHNGSGVAQAAEAVNRSGPAELLHRVASLFGDETQSDAIVDLATLRPVPPPRNVVRLDVREVTDGLVSADDAADPGVTSRLLMAPVEGHGGILKDADAIALTLRTIETGRVPPDERATALIDGASRTSELIGLLLRLGLFILVGALCLAYAVPCIRLGLDTLTAILPRARRRSP